MRAIIIIAILAMLTSCSKPDVCAYCNKYRRTIFTNDTIPPVESVDQRQFCGREGEVETRVDEFIIQGNSVTEWPGAVIIRTANCNILPDG